MKPTRLLVLIAALSLSPIANADFQAGIVAIARRDYAEALKNFKPLADKGNAAAQVNLGNLYMKGWGVEQSYPLALRWYLKAADQGERMAQSKVGILYYHGLGVAKDPAEALRWFEKAAALGDIHAQSLLGSLYAAGDGVSKDMARAYYWYTLAEEQGDPEAARGRQSLEDEITPGQKDEALKLMAETRKARIEQEEKAFEGATAGLGTPPPPQTAEPAASATGKPAKNTGTSKKKAKP